MQVTASSKKYGDKIVLIDSADWGLVKNRPLFLSKSGAHLYVRFNDTKEYLHRTIMRPPRDKVVDHIDRNTLDNRRANLRVVTTQENLRNQVRPNNRTGYTGVALSRVGKPYTAQIKHNYKKIHLGSFDTIEEAVVARRAAELRLWNM